VNVETTSLLIAPLNGSPHAGTISLDALGIVALVGGNEGDGIAGRILEQRRFEDHGTGRPDCAEPLVAGLHAAYGLVPLGLLASSRIGAGLD